MRRLIVILLVLFLSMGNLLAQEIGLIMETRTGVQLDTQGAYFLAERLYPWLAVALDKDESTLEVRGHFDLKLNVPYTDSTQFAVMGDLDLLRVSVQGKPAVAGDPSIHFELGRIRWANAGKTYLNEIADGLRLGFDFPGIGINIGAAYSGLLSKNSSGMIISRTDINRFYDSDDLLGPRRLLLQGGVKLPLDQAINLNLELTMQQDLNDPARFVAEFSEDFNSLQGGALNTQYTSLNVDGQLIPRLFYNLYFTYGSGSVLSHVPDSASLTGRSWQQVPIQSFMTGGQIQFFAPEVLNSRYSLRVAAASGDGDAGALSEGNNNGSSTLFIPLSVMPTGEVTKAVMANILFVEVLAGFKPIKDTDFSANLAVQGYFKPDLGPSGIPGTSNTATGLAGIECDLMASYRLASDVIIDLRSGLYFPIIGSAGASSIGVNPVQYALSLGVTIEL